MPVERHPSSYRDPSGYVFVWQGRIHRQVNGIYRADYEHLTTSGLYARLTEQGWLIPHEELAENLTGDVDWMCTLRPEAIPFISFPYCWTFGMLREAALLTLRVLEEALHSGMILKDASAYNIQWRGVQPVLIDTLSFERYEPSRPWVAYRQFCEHFLGPLLLMHYTGQPVQRMLIGYPEGLPLPLVRSMLPRRSRWSLHTWMHVHLHARMSEKAPVDGPETRTAFSEPKLRRLVRSLSELVASLQWKGRTTWQHYYTEAGSRGDYLEHKEAIIRQWLAENGRVSLALDLGANEGRFSRLLSAHAAQVVATDFDPGALENLYVSFKQEGVSNVLPLLIDLAAPSPAIGANNRERASFIERTQADLALALALIHHLCIGRNLPLSWVADLFARLTRRLIIEFVPKSDEKVQVLLRDKKDLYSHYSEQHFETAFSAYFRLIRKVAVGTSGRTLYLFERHA